MPASAAFSTPVDELVDQENDSVGLGQDTPLGTEFLFPSATDILAQGVVPVYSHAYSARLRVVGGPDALLPALADLGLDMGSEDWCHVRQVPGLWRAVLVGSVSIGWRKPGTKTNTKTAVARINRRYGVRLYSVGVEVTETEAFIDVAGVNLDDVSRFVESILGLTYEFAYFRAFERYITLTPRDARRLQMALVSVARWGRGAEAGKYFLLKDYEVEITLGVRRRRTVKVKLYRIGPGATAAYRLEVVLVTKTAGCRGDARGFQSEDVRKLDDVLLGLVARYGLKPIAKPSRWEPRLRTMASESPRDHELRRVRPTGWRGREVPWDIRLVVAEHNTLIDAEASDPVEKRSSRGGSTRISNTTGSTLDSSPPCSSSTQVCESENAQTPSPAWKLLSGDTLGPALYLDARFEEPSSPFRRRPSAWACPTPYGSIAHDVEALPGVYEVVLQDHQNPAPLIRALSRRLKIELGVMALQSNGLPVTSVNLIPLMDQFPADADHDVEVVVVDPSYACHFEQVFADDRGSPGPLVRSVGQRGSVHLAAGILSIGMAGALADYMTEMRRLAEDEGRRIVIITQDARPARGRGPWEKSHAYRDTRVRSTIGDAGRHCAHQRYFVETTGRGEVVRITAWKDEHEGLTGRILEQALWAGRRRRLPRRSSSRTWPDRAFSENGNSTDNSPMEP